MIIAIDGPAASGKSTTAKRVAKILGVNYIDTGAMYRACALKLIKMGIELKDSFLLQEVVGALEIRFADNGQKVLLDGADVKMLASANSKNMPRCILPNARSSKAKWKSARPTNRIHILRTTQRNVFCAEAA